MLFVDDAGMDDDWTGVSDLIFFCNAKLLADSEPWNRCGLVSPGEAYWNYFIFPWLYLGGFFSCIFLFLSCCFHTYISGVRLCIFKIPLITCIRTPEVPSTMSSYPQPLSKYLPKSSRKQKKKKVSRLSLGPNQPQCCIFEKKLICKFCVVVEILD